MVRFPWLGRGRGRVVDSAAVNPSRLVIDVEGRQLVFEGPDRLSLGRNPACDVVLSNRSVSRLHAEIARTPRGWVLRDAGSRNGIHVGGGRVSECLLEPETTVVLGELGSGTTIRVVPEHPGASADETRLRVLTIGRQASNDVVVDDLLVSRHHAQLVRHAAGWEIVDLDSHNGTFLNGQRVTRAPLSPRDLVGIGQHTFRVTRDPSGLDSPLHEVGESGGVSFEARHLVSIVAGRRLLDDVSFRLPARTLLAVVGPSGAGKSTLLGAVTGMRPATSGEVRYGDRELYSNYDELRHRLGYVPQQDLLHPQLTVSRALTYAAELRFPEDVRPEERNARIGEVLDELGLTPQVSQRIDSLSGGQRKRVSVALELLTKPSVIFLDEPTSGLDPGMDKLVMRSLRQLADGGRTIIVVTHAVTHLDDCDLVLFLAPGGHVAFLGPPAAALSYFGMADLADVFIALQSDGSQDWAKRFRNSSFPPSEPAAHELGPPAPPGPPARRQRPSTQLRTLVRRYVAVIAADRAYLAYLAALPCVLYLLTFALPDSPGLSRARSVRDGHGFQVTTVLLVALVGSCLMGSAGAVRELVKERAIYERERAIGLDRYAYVGSKILVLGAIASLQAGLLTLLLLLGRAGPDDAAALGSPTLELVVGYTATAIASMAVGLLISALVSNADRAMPLLVIVVMAQLVFSGGLFPMFGRPGVTQISWLAPARWGMALVGSTADAVPPSAPLSARSDLLWTHDPKHWGADLLVLVGLTVIILAIVVALVARTERGRSQELQKPR